jgi:protein-S-isoprenylcysteine O-methyltransferase Ste14
MVDTANGSWLGSNREAAQIYTRHPFTRPRVSCGMDLEKAVRDPWVWGQTVLLVLVGLGAPLLPRYVSLGDMDPAFNRVDPDWIRSLGLPVLAAGIALGAWGARSLGRSLTPGTEPLPGAPLVTSGAYAHVRHPIYAGVVVALTGYTLAWSNWTLALMVCLVAWTYFNAKAKAEERWLVQRHPAYEAYMRHVPRRVL